MGGRRALGNELLEPEVRYLKRRLAPAIEAMLALEGPEYQYPYFLAMHGHDISWAHPKESQVIADANAVQKTVRVTHSDLPAYFEKLRKVIQEDEMTLLKGERRNQSQGRFLDLSASCHHLGRTYLKRDNFPDRNGADLSGRTNLGYGLARRSGVSGSLPRSGVAGYLLSNHTHDANAGCASDDGTLDVQYRSRQRPGTVGKPRAGRTEGTGL
jgi:mannosylglycerate hydrolase